MKAFLSLLAAALVVSSVGCVEPSKNEPKPAPATGGS